MTRTGVITHLQKAFGLAVDQPLKAYTHFRVGGPADLLARPRSRGELIDLIRGARDTDLPVTFIGGGSNLLISDRGIRGLVILLRDMKSGIAQDPVTESSVHVSADAGERLSTLCAFANDNGLSGLEFCAGIPGTVGGAVVMNAGTAGEGICEHIVRLDALDLSTLDVRTMAAQDLAYTYRGLDLPGSVILSMVLDLAPGDPEGIRTRFNENLRHKNRTQPVSQASAGCFFKNPAPDRPAGKLIQDAGLKGLRVNDAQVSEIHANYIINGGSATCKDILALKARVQDAVQKKYGIHLETEVKVLGETE